MYVLHFFFTIFNFLSKYYLLFLNVILHDNISLILNFIVPLDTMKYESNLYVMIMLEHNRINDNLIFIFKKLHYKLCYIIGTMNMS